METPNNNFTRRTRSPYQATKNGQRLPTAPAENFACGPQKDSPQTLALVSPSCIREKDKKDEESQKPNPPPHPTLLSATKPLDGTRLDSEVVSVVMNDHNGRDEKK